MFNFILWRRNRAQHKLLVKKHKRESWKKFIETLQVKSPAANIYETLRKIKGNPSRAVHIFNNGQNYSTISDIANRLTQTFHEVSSNRSYTNDFLNYKNNKEAEAISFDSNMEPYNKQFTVQELQCRLEKTKNTVIYYQTIKQMPQPAKEYLCKIFNNFFRDSYFSEQWKMTIVVPIPQTGISHSMSTNYRPIALTSYLCKAFERVIITGY